MPSAPDREAWHVLPAEEAITAIASHPEFGLDADEAGRRLVRFGPNALREPRPRSRLAVLAHQFKSPLIFLLFGAAALALALGHRRDAVVICAVLLLNAVIGAFQEGRAERSLEALRKLATHKTRVVRAGAERLIEARALVPGDLLLLEAGDAITADARLIDGAALQIAEAALTGESVPVGKDRRPLAPDTPLADRTNMLYAGTHVTAGRARAVVVATGLSTELGRISALAEAAQEPPTPLERRIAKLGHNVIVAAAVLFLTVGIVGRLQGIALGEILMIGTSQVVSMVPEGLPVALTIALAVGVQRMARRKAIVRRLQAVETLGSTTVICSDKTGTLTRNEMTVVALQLPSGREVEVSGVGLEPTGDFRTRGQAVDALADDELRALLEAGVLCNDAILRGPVENGVRWQAIGDPTEVALVSLAMKAGVVPAELRASQPRRAEIPFDPGTKLMATQHDTPDGPRVVVKGAPEMVLELCASEPEGVRTSVESMAARTLRPLAIGVVEGMGIEGTLGFEPFRGRVRWLGLFGQMDPPRSEAKEAVARCRAAGIRPVMVTGDHRATGEAVARSLGIALAGDEVIDGRELERISDEELASRIGRIAVFARVHPAQKLRIVRAYQRRGEVVAMTGDGVNDAPALVQADVGIAMGVTGTEVAKEASNIVIADDNFATIVAAVEEGRVVYRNLQKLVLYLSATSVAEVVVLLAALLLGHPPPLQAVQILWINLVTDGMLTVTLIMEPPEGDEMRERPIPRAASILTRSMLARIGVMVPAMAASTLGWFLFRQAAGVPFAQVQTETFTLMAACQWFNVLSCRSQRQSALNLSLWRNPWLIGGLLAGNLLQAAVVFFRPLGEIFHTTPFSRVEVLGIAAVASLVLWVEELRKWIARRAHPTPPEAGRPAKAAIAPIAADRPA